MTEKPNESESAPTTPNGEQVGEHPLVLLFDGDKEVGAMKAEDGNHGIHIAANPDAVIGERGDDKFGGEVPNDYTVGMLKFTSPESIDVVIEWLWKAKRYFKLNT